MRSNASRENGRSYRRCDRRNRSDGADDPGVDLRVGEPSVAPGTDSGLSPSQSEQAALGLLDHLELGVVLVHTELVERGVLGFLERATRGLHPFHRGATFFFRARGWSTGLVGAAYRSIWSSRSNRWSSSCWWSSGGPGFPRSAASPTPCWSPWVAPSGMDVRRSSPAAPAIRLGSVIALGLVRLGLLGPFGSRAHRRRDPTLLRLRSGCALATTALPLDPAVLAAADRRRNLRPSPLPPSARLPRVRRCSAR